MYLQNIWYQAGWVDELDADGLFARTILDVPLIFFRGTDGDVKALKDRCPHRFAPLSRGRLADGMLTCGYHGLAFDGSGACVANPHGPITRSMKVDAYPVVERYEAIWVWLGNPDMADPGAIPDLTFIDDTPELARIAGYMHAAANYELMSDNILDLSHVDYLHPTTLGGIITGSKVTVEDKAGGIYVSWLSNDVIPPPAYANLVPPGSRADIWTHVQWMAPALMVLETGAVVPGAPRPPEASGLTLHNMTPETCTTTHYFYCTTRQFKTEDKEFSTFLRRVIEQAFALEDKPMLEAQQMRIGDDRFWEHRPILLNIDAGGVRARRILDAKIKAEQAAPAENDKPERQNTV